MRNNKYELNVKFLNELSLNPFARNDSSNRQYMFGSHISQCIVLNNGNEKPIQTGTEMEFGEHTFKVKMPVNAKVLKVIKRFSQSLTGVSLQYNPETIVIYEDMDNNQISYISLEHFQSHHQHFGFPNKPINENINKIHENAFIEKDTVFMDSPNVSETGEYNYGIKLETCLMTHPCVAEDAVGINRDTLKKLRFKLYDKRVLSFGKSTFPLNLYGDINTYKIMPDIGEYVREDGLLFASRSYNEDMLGMEMNIYSTQKLNPIFDNPIYTRAGKGRVVDIKILHNDLDFNIVPENMVHCLMPYIMAQKKYYTEIVEYYKYLKREAKFKYGDDDISISNELHRLIVEALIYLDGHDINIKSPVNRIYRSEPLDDFRIEVVVEYEITPNIGFKITGGRGDKGVFCKIIEPEHMPRDANGNVADILMDPGSTVNRTNLGRLYEQYINGGARDIRDKFIKELNVDSNYLQYSVEFIMEDIKATKYNLALKHIEELLGFYSIVSPKQYSFYQTLAPDEILEFYVSILKDQIIIHFPPDNPVDTISMTEEIEKNFDLVYGPVTYVDDGGRLVTTKRPIRIAPMYFLLLDKIADDWSAVSSGKLQHFGILSSTIRNEKYAYPWRKAAVKTVGETEGRLFTAYCGPKVTAELLDRSNNPSTHKNMIKNILEAPSPTNLPRAVDRNLIPLGNTKTLQLMNHIFFCNGFKMVWEPEENK